MSVAIRAELRPGDIGAIVCMHGEIYAREHGLDATFEASVAGALASLGGREIEFERYELDL